MIKTLADFKRLPVGTTLTLTQAYDWVGKDWTDHKALNKPRKIEHVQSNAIRFEGGSWLEHPTATQFVPNQDGDGFTIEYDNGMQLTYSITI